MDAAGEWDASADLGRMARLLDEADRDRIGWGLLASPERNAAALFIAGLCRDLWPLLVDARHRQAVADVEALLAGGSVGRSLGAVLGTLDPEAGAGPPPGTAQEFAAAVARELRGHDWAGFSTTVPAARDYAIEAVRRSPRTPKGADYLRPFNGTDAVLCGRLRCLIANPFRPSHFAPAWRTATVTAIAAGILADRDFSRLPVLADALEDVGCDDAELLAHARGPGPHLYGCRAVAAALGHGRVSDAVRTPAVG